MTPAGTSIVDRLAWHAELSSRPVDAVCAPLVSVLITECVANQRRESLSDLVQTLDRLNRQLNGETPSEQTSGAESIPRRLVYALAEISRLLHDAATASGGRSDLREASWQIDQAWSAILAGDIDDLGQHLTDEAFARAW